MSPMEQYLARCRELVAAVESQRDAIERVADRFARTILAGRMVHVFGSGHSRIMVEEMWPRYGSFPGFNPMVELSLSFHHPVVGSNGQRQAMFLENVPGLAARILRNFDITLEDSALVVSSSGCNIVPIEIAEGFRDRGVFVAALVSRRTWTPAHRSVRMGRNSATSPTWCSTPAHRLATRWSSSTDWRRRWLPVRRSAGAWWSIRSRPKSPSGWLPPGSRRAY